MKNSNVNEQAIQEAWKQLKRKFSYFALCMLGFFILFNVLPYLFYRNQYTVYDPATGTVYVTDEESVKQYMPQNKSPPPSNYRPPPSNYPPPSSTYPPPGYHGPDGVYPTAPFPGAYPAQPGYSYPPGQSYAGQPNTTRGEPPNPYDENISRRRTGGINQV